VRTGLDHDGGLHSLPKRTMTADNDAYMLGKAVADGLMALGRIEIRVLNSQFSQSRAL
jgi:hypothetical protein